MSDITFYFDLGSPYAYLAAERIGAVIAEPVRWQPVLLGGLFKLTDRSSWALGDYARRQRGMAEIERRADGYGLPPMRWPDPWPTTYLTAMRAATHAFRVGRGPQFTLEAYRGAFQRGDELSILAHVLGAGQRVGIRPAELLGAVGDPEVKQTLREATEDAFALGVIGVPTVAVGEELFWGDDRLDDAAAQIAAAGRTSQA
jgi:2-hydroxychromene-2-carboxylate isomerase